MIEQFLYQNFETLHEYLCNVLDKGDYQMANKLASFCELQININDSDNPLVSQFYAINMVYYLYFYIINICYSLTYHYYFRYYVLFLMIIWMLECYGKEHLYN